MKRLKVYDFNNYREYLRAVVEERKRLNRRFSFQMFASKVGTSRAYLKLITDEKRHISIEKVPAIGRFLKLGTDELQYFMFLFLENTAKDAEARTFFKEMAESVRQKNAHRGALQNASPYDRADKHDGPRRDLPETE